MMGDTDQSDGDQQQQQQQRPDDVPQRDGDELFLSSSSAAAAAAAIRYSTGSDAVANLENEESSSRILERSTEPTQPTATDLPESYFESKPQAQPATTASSTSTVVAAAETPPRPTSNNQSTSYNLMSSLKRSRTITCIQQPPRHGKLLASFSSAAATSAASSAAESSLKSSGANPRRSTVFNRGAGVDSDSDDGGMLDNSSDDESDDENNIGAVAVFSNGVRVSRPVLEPTRLSVQYGRGSGGGSEEENDIDDGNGGGDARENRNGDDDDVEQYTPCHRLHQDDPSAPLSTSVTDATVTTVRAAASQTTYTAYGSSVPPESPVVLVETIDEKRWLWCRKPLFLWSTFCIIIVFLALGVGLGVGMGSKGSSNDLAKSDDATTIAPDEPATVPPTTPPSTLDPVKTQLFQQYIVDAGVSDAGAVFEDTSSPQHKAYVWLLTEDNVAHLLETMAPSDVSILSTRYVLAVLYFTLSGDGWLNANDWLNPELDHCQWEYISCELSAERNRSFRAVTMFRTKAQLGSNPEAGDRNMGGPLPTEIAYLSKLESLQLPGNLISDVSALGSLTTLKRIDLNSNPLVNHEIVLNLYNLEILSLRETGWEGTLPTEIQSLTNMQSLELSSNNLFGELTGRFQTMQSLRDLVIDFNDFSGSIEDILNCGNCSQTLRLFRSSGNPLSGTIPQSLSQFTELQQLHIIGSDISGTIPESLGLLTNMFDLDLSSNGVFDDSNRLPSELGLLTNLEHLYVANSFVVGRVPEEFGNMTALVELGIHGTLMTGTIPSSLCSAPNLNIIYHSNDVECDCPETICSLPF